MTTHEKTTDLTGAPTDLTGGMPATDSAVQAAVLSARELADLAAVADLMIPAAHAMPSAADVVTVDRLRFVLSARPDLVEPLRRALREELGADPHVRLDALAAEATNLAALQLVIVAGYYTDRGVRELIGYPGQMAIELKSWIFPPYLEEGLIDAVMARGPVWRDPDTGKRAAGAGAPKTYEERAWAGLAGTQEGDG